jgi:lipoprotein-releasing system permease protein
VSVITLISIVGVTLGVAVLIIVMSVMSGFDLLLRERLLNFNYHIKVFAKNRVMTDYNEVRDKLLQNESVKGVAPFVIGPVLIETQPNEGSSQISTPMVRGLDIDLERTVSSLVSSNSLVEGEMDLSGGLLVGSEIRSQLNLKVGDYLAVHSPRSFHRIRESQEEGKEAVLLPDDFEVRGVMDLGLHGFNANFILTSLENAQDFFDLGDAVHALSVKLEDASLAEITRRQLLDTLPSSEYRIITWEDENSQMLEALQVERNVMFYLLFFVMIVAAFGITSSQITFVVQRTPEIGTLKALGANGGQIMRVFLSQSFLVALLGLVFGFGFGLLALEFRNEFLAFMRDLSGFEIFPASIYGFQALPAEIVTSDLIKIGIGSFFICILAGFLPAWNASRLRPVEAFRHE